MNKYNLFFRLIKLYSFIGLVFGTIFIGGLYTMYIIFNDPNFAVMNVYLMGFTILTCLSVLIPKAIYNVPKSSTADYFMMMLLPVSMLNKYMIIVISALVMFLSAMLVSLPLEMIGNLLTTSYSPDRQIVIGGMIKYFGQSGIINVLLAELSLGLFSGLLFRNNFGAFIPLFFVSGVIGYVFGSYIAVLHGGTFHVLSVPMSVSVICLFLTIAFLILGYQVFKRWQLANNGVLMI